MAFYPLVGVNTPFFDPARRYVTSNILSPKGLAILRSVLALYTLAALITNLTYQSVELHKGNGFFIYFTNLTYTGLCAYFFASSVQTVAYARRLKRCKDPSYSSNADTDDTRKLPTYPLQSWPRFLQFLHVFLYCTVITFPLVVTVCYWALLTSSATFSTAFYTWQNISFHAMNLLFAYVELIFSRGQPKWLHLPFIVIIAALYLGLAYLGHATLGFYPYDFLDPSEGPVLGAYIVGILVGMIVSFLISFGLCALRDRIWGRRTRPFGEAPLDSSPEAQHSNWGKQIMTSEKSQEKA